MKKMKCPALFYFPKGKKKRAEACAKTLKKLYPDAKCALEFENDPFRLLVMARLSAQCTDKRVNEVSVALFQRFPDAAAFARADLDELENAIRPCGLYHTKAKQIKAMCQELLDRHFGLVPKDKSALLALSGVGEKIANLMLGDVFGDPRIVADTHCIRLAGRWELTKSENPTVVTRDLEKLIKKEEQSDFCHRLIQLGREYCRAQNPKCEICPFREDAK